MGSYYTVLDIVVHAGNVDPTKEQMERAHQ